MPYATPTAYLQRYGLDEAAQLLGDEEQLLTAQLLKDAIAVADGGSWTGNPSDAEKAAAQAALDRLTTQLTTTSNFMDGYLRAAVALPLDPNDANAGTLADCCMALTRCAIADDPDNATERMDATCESWRAWLKDIARKVVQLVGSDGTPAPTSSGVRTGQASSAYAWGLYGGVQ